MTDLVSEPVIQFFVQLGALGALIVLVIYYMRGRESAANKELESRLQRDREELKAREKRDNFIEGIVEKSNTRQEEEAKAWRDMTRETITVFQEFTSAINELTAYLRETRGTLSHDHNELYSKTEGLSEAIKKLQDTLIESRGEVMGRISQRES